MPVDRGQIDQQLRALREGEHWWELREFRELPHLLYDEERIVGLIRGKVLGRLPQPRPMRRCPTTNRPGSRLSRLSRYSKPHSAGCGTRYR